MKTILSILIASFALITLTAQTIYQEGLAREINSNKRPLGGVSIKFENAPSQVSDDDGKFRLAFKNKKIGDLIFLEEIKKSGYELVNRKDFEVTKISNINQLGVDVILAATGYVDAAKKEYYEVSDKALLAGFEKEKKALRQQLNATKLNQEEYLNQLQSLQEQYDIQRENLDALANKFARINFDDVSPIYEEALELFKAGKIDQAIQTLENTNPGARTNQIIQEEKRIAIAQKDLDQQKVKLAADKKKQIATVRLLADMYSVQFSPAKAEQQYDDLLQLDSTDLEILREAANFYREQHRYTKALNLYPKIIAHPQAESWQVANAHSGIGNLHTTTGNLNSALKAYTQFYNYYESFLKKDSFNTFYLNNLAISYSKLGETHTALGNLEKAVKFYEKDLELTKQLFEEYPNNVSFKNGLAISYSKLGETHTALGNLDRALNYFEQRYELGKQLFEAYPNNVSFKNGLAISYSKLGSTHTALGNLDKALKFYEKDLELTKQLFEAYPNNVSFKNGLAISYEKLGSTHTALGNLDKALKFYEKDLELTKQLFEAYPNNVSFKNGLAIAYAKLGVFSQEQLADVKKAKSYFIKAEKLWIELVKDAPQYVEFQQYLSLTRQKLSELNTIRITRLNQQIQNETDTVKLYQLYTSLCDTLRTYTQKDTKYEADFSQALNSRAWYGFFLKKFPAVESDIREGMALATKNKYLATNLPPALLLQGKYKEALVAYRKYKDLPFGVQGLPTYKEAFLDDLNAFEKAGIIPPQLEEDVNSIRRMLQGEDYPKGNGNKN